MRTFIIGAVLGVTLAFTSASAQVQNPGVQQSGVVAANDCVKWGPGTGQIQSAGAACLTSSSGVVSFNARTGVVLPATNDYTFAQLAGSIGCAQYAPLTGDITTSGCAATLATVNANIGTFGSATQAGQFAINAKGLITSAASITVTPSIASVTGLGTGVATWLATPSSANLAAAMTDETGTGALVFANGATMTGAFNATNFAVLSNGNIGVGTETNPQGQLVISANTVTGFGSPNGITIVGADGVNSGVTEMNYGVANGLFTYQQAGGTGGTPTSTTAGQTIGTFAWTGYVTGTGFLAPRARIVGLSLEAGVFSGTNQGTGLRIDTTPAGSIARSQSGIFMGGFIVGTGTTDPGNGGIYVGARMADYGYSYQTPATGFAITLGSTTWHTILDPAGTLATGTLTTPATPIDGMVVDVRTSQIITSLTVTANAGQSVKGAPSTLALGGVLSCVYRLTNTTWYC